MHTEREVMSLLPTKTVSVQIKLDLRRPGTFNYPKYPHPKYHQRRCDLTSTRINGVLTKFLTLRASHPNRLPVCMEWQTVFFSSVWVWTTVHTRGRNEKAKWQNWRGNFYTMTLYMFSYMPWTYYPKVNTGNRNWKLGIFPKHFSCW